VSFHALSAQHGKFAQHLNSTLGGKKIIPFPVSVRFRAELLAFIFACASLEQL
jgi:hypothetical protein